MNKTLSRGLMACLSFVALASCQDYDGGFSLDTIKKAEYAKHFEDTFGKIDPNQDWSMATLVKANVNLPGLTGTAKMNICTGDPRNSETRLLAQIMLKDGKGSIDFDAIKGSDNVFVTVEQDGEYKVFSPYAIQNGMLNIGEVATRGGVGSVIEKTEFSADCPTTLNTDANGKVTVSSLSYTTDKILGATFNNVYKTFDQWTEWVPSNVNQYGNQSPFTTESVLKWKQGYMDFSNATLSGESRDNGNGTITVSWGETKTIEEWKGGYSQHNIPTQPWTGVQYSYRDCQAGDPGAEPNGYTDPSTWVIRDGAVATYELKQPVWQYLKNVEQVPAPGWNRAFGHTLFSAGGFFEEREAYYGEKKRALYQPEDLAKIEKGFVIESTGGPITLPFIFGNTAFANQFGYVYWKDGQDPLQQTHYVLIEDARPSSNIYWENWGVSGNKVGNEALCGWDTGINGLDSYNAAYSNRETNPEMWEKVAGQQVVGTSYRVMYFDADGNGTYNFPEGYKIAFFIDKMGGESDLTGHSNHCDKNYNYSLPELNKRLYNYTNLSDPSKVANRHNYSYSGSPTYDDHHNETNGMVDGIVKTISWQQDGNYYLGFGDDSGDHDLNDIVFMVQGNFKTDSGIKLSSVKWHRNTDGSHHTSDDDIFEQSTPKIGETYTQPSSEPKRDGYTFLGWSLTPDNHDNDCSKSVSGTATEDGICYFAIWEPNEEPGSDNVTIRWHLNYNGTHGAHSGASNDVYATNTVAKSTGTYSKPATNPSYSDATKVFKGWAETQTITSDSELLTDSQLTNVTAGDQDKCYYAIWGPAPSPSGDPEPISWIFACEDLGGTFDYDFNDVVWEVKYAAGSTNVEVRLLAAGGTLPFTLNFNSQKVYTKEEAFGSSTKVEIKPNPTDWKKFTVANTWSLWSNRQEFVVAVEGNEGTSYISAYSKNDEQGATNTKTPEVIILPATWRWPLESVKISTAYPGFTEWVKNESYVVWPTPVEDTTVTR